MLSNSLLSQRRVCRLESHQRISIRKLHFLPKYQNAPIFSSTSGRHKLEHYIPLVAAPLTPTSTPGNQHRLNLFQTPGTSLAAFNQSQFNYRGSSDEGRLSHNHTDLSIRPVMRATNNPAYTVYI